MNIKRYAAVEIRAFGQGMTKLFEGVAEVFAAIGAEEPDRLALEKAKWKHAETDGISENKPDTDEGEPAHENEEIGTGSDAPDCAGNNDDVAVASENDSPVMEKARTDKNAGKAVEAEAPENESVKKAAKKGKTAQSSVSQDDITKIIVRKIKQNRSNNEKIGQLLKTYGATRVSDLPEDKYEAFITDLSVI